MSPEETENQKIAAGRLSRADKLAAMPEFWWFMRECIIKEMENLDVGIHDERKGSDERNILLHKWTAYNSVLKWPDAEREAAGNTLGHSPKEKINYHAE